MAGCGCKSKTPQTTTQTSTQATPNQVDEQRVSQIKKEIKNIVSKYYVDGTKTKG